MTYIKELVAQLIERHGSSDPFRLCGALDIEVLDVDLPHHIRGFYTCQMKTKFIYLNTSLAPAVRSIVCAHELGHALLHESHNSLFLQEHTQFVKERFEREADVFAAYLLLGPLAADDCANVETISLQAGVPVELVQKCLGSLC